MLKLSIEHQITYQLSIHLPIEQFSYNRDGHTKPIVTWSLSFLTSNVSAVSSDGSPLSHYYLVTVSGVLITTRVMMGRWILVLSIQGWIIHDSKVADGYKVHNHIRLDSSLLLLNDPA